MTANSMRAGAVVALLVLAAGCGGDVPGPDVFDHAEYLVLEGRFEEAIPVLKRFLVHHPEHTGAHYYLGRAYYNATETFWFAIAEGEIRTALALFHRQNRANPIDRFSPEYFEFSCHLDIARIHGRQAAAAIAARAPARLVSAIIASGEEALAEAERVMPGATEVDQIQEGFDALRGDSGAEKPPAGGTDGGGRSRFI